MARGDVTDTASLLLSCVDIGALRLRNRIVMAPMTRSRADAHGLVPPSAALYYQQRAGAGLIVSEGVCISPTAVGNPGLPGIWNDAQVRRWRTVTERVHGAGGLIVLQLWHTGRASHPSVQPGGQLPVAPSAIAIDGSVFTSAGRVPFPVPHALERAEIAGVVREFADGAGRALAAGFDAVEIHGANGYLPDQFLHASSNQRTDDYGGTIPNRARFMLEVASAVAATAGADRTGLRLSPASAHNGMQEPDPGALYGYLLARLAPLRLAYLHIIEPWVQGVANVQPEPGGVDAAWVRQRWGGGLIAAGGYDKAMAIRALRSGRAEAIAFGRPFISNPDLPRRLVEDLPLALADPAVYYGFSDAGYVDYPTWDEARRAC